MPVDNETLAKIGVALGADGTELFEALKTVTTTDVAAFDQLRASESSLSTKLETATASVTSLTGERDQALVDLETASSDDALKQMTAERDRAASASKGHKAELAGLHASIKTGKIGAALRTALFDGKTVDANRQAAAMELMMAKGTPTGVDFDDAGALMGHVAVIAAFEKSYPFMVAGDKPAGNQGGGNGSDDPPDPNNDGTPKTGYDNGRARATAVLESNSLSPAA